MPPTILLSCESISKSYGVKPLFADLSIGLAEGDHVGLVGPNGSGKSTLLKIMAGLEEPDEGTRSMRRQLRVGYVPQEPSLDGAHTIRKHSHRSLSTKVWIPMSIVIARPRRSVSGSFP